MSQAESIIEMNEHERSSIQHSISVAARVEKAIRWLDAPEWARYYHVGQTMGLWCERRPPNHQVGKVLAAPLYGVDPIDAKFMHHALRSYPMPARHSVAPPNTCGEKITAHELGWSVGDSGPVYQKQLDAQRSAESQNWLPWPADARSLADAPRTAQDWRDRGIEVDPIQVNDEQPLKPGEIIDATIDAAGLRFGPPPSWANAVTPDERSKADVLAEASSELWDAIQCERKAQYFLRAAEERRNIASDRAREAREDLIATCLAARGVKV